jgi:hypothetical protein
MSSMFSHFVDAQDFLGSGGEGEAARDGWLPRGQEIFGKLDPRTGSQEIVVTRKMGNRVCFCPQGIRCLLQVCKRGKSGHGRHRSTSAFGPEVDVEPHLTWR